MKMKKLGLIIVAFTVTSLSMVFGSETKNEAGEAGIVFHEGSWDQALQLAKEENKLIFLDVYATWCGPCKRLKANTFPDAAVGEFYNANFINVALDGEKGEGLELARKYNVRSYPSLLFIDSNGQIVGRTAGFHNPDRFLELGRAIVNL
ncbi:MAG: thioredoxin family protein [Bacteroidales bacterium]|nr:thioredoxin family protein [Bacteroidales bacterium]